MLPILFEISLLLFSYVTLWFIVSIIKKRNDVADIAWGLGFVVICLYLIATQVILPISVLVYTLVTIWGLRLAIHISMRSKGKNEDFRYQKWREEWGKYFLIRSYLQVYVLQGFFMGLISIPILIASFSAPQYLTAFSIIGFFMWSLVLVLKPSVIIN
jgi:steroid 5-alpha reductase family enzyme